MFKLCLNCSNKRSMFSNFSWHVQTLWQVFKLCDNCSNKGGIFSNFSWHVANFWRHIFIFEDMFTFLETYSRWGRSDHAKFWSCTFSGGDDRFIFCQRLGFEGSPIFLVVYRFLATASIKVASCYFFEEGWRQRSEHLRFLERQTVSTETIPGIKMQR